MKPKIIAGFKILLALVVLQACIFSSAVPPTAQELASPATPTMKPFVPETDGPPGFSATLTAPDIVLLSWDPAEQAVGYEIQLILDGLEPLTIARLPAEATQFEHFMAPESSLLTYRLQTITSDGPAGASSLQITTQAHQPNPVTVQPTLFEDEAASAVIG